MPIKREDFVTRVKPILENKDVKSLFKYKLPKDEEDSFQRDSFGELFL